MARVSAAERRRRKASDEAAYARGRLTAIDYNQDVEEAAVHRDNRGRVGGVAPVAPQCEWRTTVTDASAPSPTPCHELQADRLGGGAELDEGRLYCGADVEELQPVGALRSLPGAVVRGYRHCRHGSEGNERQGRRRCRGSGAAHRPAVTVGSSPA